MLFCAELVADVKSSENQWAIYRNLEGRFCSATETTVKRRGGQARDSLAPPTSTKVQVSLEAGRNEEIWVTTSAGQSGLAKGLDDPNYHVLFRCNLP